MALAEPPRINECGNVSFNVTSCGKITPLTLKTISPTGSAESLKGWLPVDAVVQDGRPGLWWMDMSGVSLTEPFFQQTVERARTDGNSRAELFTEFDVLVQLEKLLDSVPPSGFIFHSSRCGSTLLANACRAVADSIVLSEAYAIDKLIARFITDTTAGDVKEAVYSVFLRGVVHVLGQRRTGRERRLCVKFSCCSVAQIERVRRIWPQVPWIFLYRDPVETIVSNLSDVPPWLIDGDRRILASIVDASPAAVAEMTLAELCARAVGAFYEQAHRLANGNCMLLNYKQLSPAVISRTLSFFNVSPSPTEMEAIARLNEVYSKAVSGTRQFVADGEAKQKLASSLVREMAERWAIEPYRLLEQKRLNQLTIQRWGE